MDVNAIKSLKPFEKWKISTSVNFSNDVSDWSEIKLWMFVTDYRLDKIIQLIFVKIKRKYMCNLGILQENIHYSIIIKDVK